jgi:predicted transcriptional regulator
MNANDQIAAPVEEATPTTTTAPAAAESLRSRQLWTGPVIDRGYSIVPAILMWGQARLGITPNEMNVLLQIISHRWSPGNDPWIAKETIAARIGKDARTIQRCLTSLEKKGLVRRVRRFKPSKGQDANGYDVGELVEKLKAIAPEFAKVSDQNKRRRAKVEKVG